jgi:hypothetical protein
MKILTTPMLEMLNAQAAEFDFNRYLYTEFLTKLDPDGYHVLMIIVPNHIRTRLDSDATKPADPAHHRLLVYCKLADSDHPVQAFLDVTAEEWDKIPEYKS